MGTVTLVRDQIEDGQKLIKQLASEGFDVTAAFWVSFPLDESGPWFYIVSKVIDQQGLLAAYRAVRMALPHVPAPWGPWISVSELGELRLVGLNDPLAKDVLALRNRFPGRNRFREIDIGHHTIEELYLYPPMQQAVDADSTASSQ